MIKEYFDIGMVIEPDPLPTNKLKIEIEFDCGDTYVAIREIECASTMVVWVKTIELYITSLETDWSAWCNPDIHKLVHLMGTLDNLPEEYLTEDVRYDLLSNIWSSDHEYGEGSLARADSVDVTYFDTHSVEYALTLKEQK